jgi:hypothetical protein
MNLPIGIPQSLFNVERARILKNDQCLPQNCLFDHLRPTWSHTIGRKNRPGAYEASPLTVASSGSRSDHLQHRIKDWHTSKEGWSAAMAAKWLSLVAFQKTPSRKGEKSQRTTETASYLLIVQFLHWKWFENQGTWSMQLAHKVSGFPLKESLDSWVLS